MATGRFLISRDATGAFHWALRDASGATVVESGEGFAEHKACEAAVERLRKAVSKADVLDLTMPATVIKPKGSGGKGAGKAVGAKKKVVLVKKKGKKSTK